MAVIPLGGNNITQDLGSQQIDEDEAENLKVKYGSAYSELSSEELAKNLLVNNGRTIEERLLVDIVEAREEEILSNVAAQIRNSGYQDKLVAGVVLSGAAANVKNLDKAVSERIHPDKIRFARIVPFPLQAVHPDQVAKDGSLNVLLSLLNEGDQNCTLPKVKEEPPMEEKDVEKEVAAAAAAPAVHEEEPPAVKEEKKKNKPGFWKKFKERLEDWTNTVTEE